MERALDGILKLTPLNRQGLDGGALGSHDGRDWQSGQRLGDGNGGRMCGELQDLAPAVGVSPRDQLGVMDTWASLL